MSSDTGSYSDLIFGSTWFANFEEEDKDMGPLQKESVESYKSLYKKAQEDKELQDLAKRPVSHILAIELEKRAEEHLIETRSNLELTEKERGFIEVNAERTRRIVRNYIK
jgi:hypothetical protein